MFENTFHKLKICAYVYFIGSVINQVYREFYQFIVLGCDFRLIPSLIYSIFNTVVVSFIFGLMIYGFGKIVKHFEDLNNNDE